MSPETKQQINIYSQGVPTRGCLAVALYAVSCGYAHYGSVCAGQEFWLFYVLFFKHCKKCINSTKKCVNSTKKFVNLPKKVQKCEENMKKNLRKKDPNYTNSTVVLPLNHPCAQTSGIIIYSYGRTNGKMNSKSRIEIE